MIRDLSKVTRRTWEAPLFAGDGAWAWGWGPEEPEGPCELGSRPEELGPAVRQVCLGSAFKGSTERGCAEHSCPGGRGRNPRGGVAWGPDPVPCSHSRSQSRPSPCPGHLCNIFTCSLSPMVPFKCLFKLSHTRCGQGLGAWLP